MPLQDYDVLLHKMTKHTNLSIPYSDFVHGTKLPEQNTDLLNTILTLKYKNDYNVPTELPGPEKHYDDFYTLKNFRILRCDKTEPFKMVGITEDYEIIVVLDSRNYENEVPRYAIQATQYIGISCKDQYVTLLEDIESYTLRVDESEPCLAVIAEYISEEEFRIVLGDECFTKCYKYIDDPNTDPHTMDYRYNRYLLSSDIIRLRKNILRGRKPYGSLQD